MPLGVGNAISAHSSGSIAQHTQEELEELYFSRTLDEDAFIRYGNEMLDGVAVFWDGLDEQRKRLPGPDGLKGSS